MEPLNAYADLLNHLPIDLRAEVVLADMLEDGVSVDDLIIHPVGLFKRPFGRDISGVEWTETPTHGQRKLRIDLNRSGLYDLLPEGVFHQPTSNETASSTESTLREMAIQREREEEARRFFGPFEQEFFLHRLRIEQEQRLFLFGADDRESDEALGWFWNLPRFLTPRQGIRLLYLLPVMAQIAGNLPLMEACFGQLINEPVSLRMEPPEPTYLQRDTPALGAWQLGLDSVFDGWLADGEPVLWITVRIDRTDQLPDYLPGGTGQQLIDWLTGYLVPLDTSVRLHLDTSTLGETFQFTDDETVGRLDFSTFI